MSLSVIGRSLSCSKQNVHGIICTARAKLFRAYSSGYLDGTSLVEGLFAPSPTSSITSNVGLAASRQEELLDALELLMERRAAEAAAYRECMSGDSSSQTQVKRNTFDLWELRYAMAHRCVQLPTSAYDAHRAGRYCDTNGG